MNIAYITEPLAYIGGLGNGVNSQAMRWAKSLRECGCLVEQVSPWGHYDWGRYDIIHIFGSNGMWFLTAMEALCKRNPRVIWSPVCDNTDRACVQRLKSFAGSGRLRVFSCAYIRRKAIRQPCRIMVRSNYERDYLVKAYGAALPKIIKVPVAMSYGAMEHSEPAKKENFCFHLSSLYQERKNVVRLIRAARRYGFRLILAGTKGSTEEFARIETEIAGCPNIEVLGFLTEEQKIDLYRRAKVFALPSIKEGVGIAALDAAHFGCRIVITSIGGPKEYFGGMATAVNPFDIDEIGRGIVAGLACKEPCHELQAWINRSYSPDMVAKQLMDEYERVLHLPIKKL